MYSLRTIIRIAFLLISANVTSGLRDVDLKAPEAVELGSRLEMNCLYDLEGEVLYTVKWYRGDREFCRYSPRDVPPLKIFQIKSFDVSYSLGTIVREETNAHRLVIENVTYVANGWYTCEVSADEPSFATTRVYKHVYVVELPKGYPQVTGLRPRYRPGAKLKAECVSANSSPAANLSFFINDEPALKQHVWHRVDGNESQGLLSAYSTIQFIVQPHHFRDGRLKLRCTAIIYSIYLRSMEKSAEEVKIPTTTTTTTSLPKPRKAVKHRIHHFPEEKDSAAQVAPSSASQGVCTITLLFFSLLVNSHQVRRLSFQ